MNIRVPFIFYFLIIAHSLINKEFNKKKKNIKNNKFYKMYVEKIEYKLVKHFLAFHATNYTLYIFIVITKIANRVT